MSDNFRFCVKCPFGVTYRQILQLMIYNELQLTASADFTEILMAELAEIGYESFVETDAGLNAYIQLPDYNPAALLEIIAKYQPMTAIAWQVKTLEEKNWNEEWERNYEPIEVEDKIRIRATHHAAKPEFAYDIVINPKMSFGTGHHETTASVMALQLGIDHNQKTVLDVGSGTGILAILALKMGASRATAFDIEEWAYLNAVENVELNGCEAITVFQGTIEDCPADQYDIVLANINRNILLREIRMYATFMAPNAKLIVSGFYTHDETDIEAEAAKVGLQPVQKRSLNNWSAIVFERKN